MQKTRIAKMPQKCNFASFSLYYLKKVLKVLFFFVVFDMKGDFADGTIKVNVMENSLFKPPLLPTVLA